MRGEAEKEGLFVRSFPRKGEVFAYDERYRKLKSDRVRDMPDGILARVSMGITARSPSYDHAHSQTQNGFHMSS
jgi:hypothetical protein